MALGRHRLLPLDSGLYALQLTLPRPPRRDIGACNAMASRICPGLKGDKPKRQRFKHDAIGFSHMDIAEVQTAEGKPHLFMAVDRTTNIALTQLVAEADRTTA